jgi:hypothetical protein
MISFVKLLFAITIAVVSSVSVFQRVKSRPSLLNLPLPESCPAVLQTLVLPIIGPEPDSSLRFLGSEELQQFSKIPNCSGSGVITFLQTQEDALISEAIAATEDECGDIKPTAKDYLRSELSSILKWFAGRVYQSILNITVRVQAMKLPI